MSAAKTDAQRKAAERQRYKAAGLSEVRGIYATAEDIKTIKAYAAKLTERRARAKKRAKE